ncbi:ethanolamine ammonia-lyase light chain EutC, partial [Mycobacteroides salmoniphilum]
DDHGVPLLQALHQRLHGYSIAPLVIATQARVALGDHIGVALGVDTVLVLIGERPGLSVADSVGIYLTHNPVVGCSDAQRNCVSNIHPPEGLGYDQAAQVVAALVAGAREIGRSGVALKDMTGAGSQIEGSGPALTT